MGGLATGSRGAVVPFLGVNLARLDCARPIAVRSEVGAPGRSCVAGRGSPALASTATRGRRLDTRRERGGVSPEAPIVLSIFFVNSLAEEDDGNRAKLERAGPRDESVCAGSRRSQQRSRGSHLDVMASSLKRYRSSDPRKQGKKRARPSPYCSREYPRNAYRRNLKSERHAASSS